MHFYINNPYFMKNMKETELIFFTFFSYFSIFIAFILVIINRFQKKQANLLINFDDLLGF